MSCRTAMKSARKCKMEGDRTKMQITTWTNFVCEISRAYLPRRHNDLDTSRPWKEKGVGIVSILGYICGRDWQDDEKQQESEKGSRVCERSFSAPVPCDNQLHTFPFTVSVFIERGRTAACEITASDGATGAQACRRICFISSCCIACTLYTK